MRNRELVLALAIVGALAWTARAGDDPFGRSIEERLSKIEEGVGRFEERIGKLADRVDRLERRGAEAPKPTPAGPPRTFESLEDPMEVSRNPPGDESARALGLRGEWIAVYRRAIESSRRLAVALDALRKAGQDSALAPAFERHAREWKDVAESDVEEAYKAQVAYRDALKAK